MGPFIPVNVAGKSKWKSLPSPSLLFGDTCTGPQVKTSVYTTTEATASSDTVFIVQFSLTCKNGAKNVNLYADINGKTVAVTQAAEGSEYQYQVSTSDENKNLPSGSYNIKFYDEDGYSILRKAQRSGDNVDSVSSLFTITVNHPGVWKGPFVQTEFLAAMTAILVWYAAYSAKARLQSSWKTPRLDVSSRVSRANPVPAYVLHRQVQAMRRSLKVLNPYPHAEYLNATTSANIFYVVQYVIKRVGDFDEYFQSFKTLMRRLTWVYTFCKTSRLKQLSMRISIFKF